MSLIKKIASFIIVFCDFHIFSSSLLPFPIWTIHDCNFGTGENHPVSRYSPNTINLLRLSWQSNAFWMEFSWSCDPQISCNLERGTLYRVTRVSNGSVTHFLYSHYSSHREFVDNATQSVQCDVSVAQIQDSVFGSYGFISCSQDFNIAQLASLQWEYDMPVTLFVVTLYVFLACILLVLLVFLCILTMRMKRRGNVKEEKKLSAVIFNSSDL